jgi:hypothetical protein
MQIYTHKTHTQTQHQFCVSVNWERKDKGFWVLCHFLTIILPSLHYCYLYSYLTSSTKIFIPLSQDPPPVLLGIIWITKHLINAYINEWIIKPQNIYKANSFHHHDPLCIILWVSKYQSAGLGKKGKKERKKTDGGNQPIAMFT